MEKPEPEDLKTFFKIPASVHCCAFTWATDLSYLTEMKLKLKGEEEVLSPVSLC